MIPQSRQSLVISNSISTEAYVHLKRSNSRNLTLDQIEQTESYCRTLPLAITKRRISAQAQLRRFLVGVSLEQYC